MMKSIAKRIDPMLEEELNKVKNEMELNYGFKISYSKASRVLAMRLRDYKNRGKEFKL